MTRIDRRVPARLKLAKDVILVGENRRLTESVVIDANLPHQMESDKKLNGVFMQLETTRIRQFNISIVKFRYQIPVEFR